MIRIEHAEIWGWEHAIRGMRNPMNSWDKSDSGYVNVPDKDPDGEPIEVPMFNLGDNDLNLMKRLYNAGTEHRKYLRQVFISVDITAPLYWWKEFDTYKVGTTANSCSTMHKIADHDFTRDDFSYEHLDEGARGCLDCTIENLNWYRNRYLKSKSKDEWWNMIQLLPSSFNQKRTVTLNYENAVSMIKQRKNHKLDEWRVFVDFLQHLPYVDLFGGDLYEKE